MSTKNSLLQLKSIIAGFTLLLPVMTFGQNAAVNVQVRARAVDQHTIKLRWAPANTSAWADGIKYGYAIERYTLVKDSVYQLNPERVLLKQSLKPAPLPQWEELANRSDYAAVIAQAFYGDEFELTGASKSNIGEIINQATELQQRFATSIFMAENDYAAAELAAWAYTDHSTNEKDQYLYRIILERPKKLPGDTAVVFMGYKDKQALPKPLELTALWGDKAVILSWNYELLATTYHSYHLERKTDAEENFKRITELPVTAMGENMQTLFHTDSLPDNETVFSYRIIGITNFDEEGLPSDTITGTGMKPVNCIPNIYAGYFVGKDTARLFWHFDCEDSGLIDKLVVKRASIPDGDYEIVRDNVPVDTKELDIILKDEINYVKIFALTKDSTETASFPFSLNQVDSIPPAVPVGLKVEIDSTAVAHLTWTANVEPDLMGYRILRAFTPDGEKSPLTSDFITGNHYTDTLSLALGNEKVYYSLTALDVRFNESQACATVEAVKPNNITPAAPRFTGYEIQKEGKVFLSWMTDNLSSEIDYFLTRASSSAERDTVFTGNEKIRTFTDELSESGDYEYLVIAKNRNNRKETYSPQKISVSITVSKEMKAVSNFHSYVDVKDKYIELSWKKHPEAVSYTLYKKTGEKPVVFWKEVDASINRIVDEVVLPDTRYEYTIVYTPQSGGMSQAKTIAVYY
ncbi:hypothetical protein FACS189426_18600 [Bacteroidia bacterium]|nr:hypothetical protein FACS189426_18600 [Bacteroidia bacterium]GHV71454.1 hypothetical protein FACS189420_6650 [Bacteroidia bacterium]